MLRGKIFQSVRIAPLTKQFSSVQPLFAISTQVAPKSHLLNFHRNQIRVPIHGSSLLVRPFSSYQPNKPGDEDKDKETKPNKLLGYLGSAGLAVSVLAGKTTYLLVALKLTKMAPLVSMVISSFAYSLIFGWPYAIGMVGLIFVHESGHALVMRHYGVPFSPMVFLPFMGAVIGMKEEPKSAYEDAMIAFGGPVAGSAAALAVGLTGSLTEGQLLLALADWGYLINFFNLVPLGSMDGGRIAGAVSPYFGLAGLGMGGALIYNGMLHNPLVYLILLGGVYSTGLRLLGFDKKKHRGYYDIPKGQQRKIMAGYVSLIAALAVAMSVNNSRRKSPRQIQEERGMLPAGESKQKAKMLQQQILQSTQPKVVPAIGSAGASADTKGVSQEFKAAADAKTGAHNAVLENIINNQRKEAAQQQHGEEARPKEDLRSSDHIGPVSPQIVIHFQPSCNREITLNANLESSSFSPDLYEFVDISNENPSSVSSAESGGLRGSFGGVPVRSSGPPSQAPQGAAWIPRDSITVERDHFQQQVQQKHNQQQQQQRQGSNSSLNSYDNDYKGQSYDEDRGDRAYPPQQSASKKPPPYATQSAGASGGSSGARGAPVSSAPSSMPLTAEERLRNLMADMQRHKQESNLGSSGSQLRPIKQDEEDAGIEGEEEALMGEENYLDDDRDPLSAFQRMQRGGAPPQSGSRTSSGASGVSARHDITMTSGGTSITNAINSRYRTAPQQAAPTGERSAWGSSGVSTGSRGTSPASSRPACPGPGQTPPSSAGGMGSRYASLSAKVQTSAPRNVSSNTSVNSLNSSGSAANNQVGVGSDVNSSSRIYRHGSPAPNMVRPTGTGAGSSGARTNMNPNAVRRDVVPTQINSGDNFSQRKLNRSGYAQNMSGGGGGTNSSVSSLGSGIIGTAPASGYGTQRANPRYASPQQATRPSSGGGMGTSAPRTSNASFHSADGSADLRDRIGSAGVRRSVGQAPLRGSYNAGSNGIPSTVNGTSGGAGTARRCGTPQQQPPRRSTVNGDRLGSSGEVREMRSGTSTRTGSWKF